MPRNDHQLPAARPVARELTRACSQTLAEWRRRARSRGLLATMSERELRDIGLDRASAMFERSKSFWSK